MVLISKRYRYLFLHRLHLEVVVSEQTIKFQGKNSVRVRFVKPIPVSFSEQRGPLARSDRDVLGHHFVKATS